MANIKELVASMEIELEAAQQREMRARKEMELILATTQQEMRTDLTPEEDTRFDSLKETVQNARVDQASVQRKLAKARAVQADEARTDSDLSSATTPAGLPQQRDAGTQRTASVSVGREERTYNKGTDPAGKMFLNDVVRQFTTNDVRAAGRLQAHMREEQVDRAQQGMELRVGEVGTSAFSGLVVPQYLVDMVAPAVAGLRPFADACNQHPLPASGMSLNISRITTASGAALQASESTAVQATAMDDTLLTFNVQTAAGQQTISRQAIERGTGIEDVVMQDLFRQYATSLDSTLLNQATTGLDAVANATTAITTADLATLYPAIMGAASQSDTATRGLAHPTHVVMHPRRWYWLQSLLTATWPAFSQPGTDPRAVGNNSATPYNQGSNGVMPNGMQVITDANVTTVALAGAPTGGTQDHIFVVPQQECHLWEDQGNPVYIRAEQPAAASLGVLLVVYGYFAYTFQRYGLAMQKINGAALAAPAGF
jgi:hypothetical protein